MYKSMETENIAINNVEIYGLNESIIASGYPMLSEVGDIHRPLTDKDNTRFSRLTNFPSGEGHHVSLQGIIVQFDLTAPIKMWVEMQRYHFVEFVSSMSTMHRIAKFNLDKSYDKHVDKAIIDRMKELQQEYLNAPSPENYLKLLMSNPCGIRLPARLSTNYRQLKTIVYQRKGHRLPHWADFIEWCRRLPYSEAIFSGNYPSPKKAIEFMDSKGYHFFQCPKCSNFVLRRVNFCSECGQKLEWK